MRFPPFSPAQNVGFDRAAHNPHDKNEERSRHSRTTLLPQECITEPTQHACPQEKWEDFRKTNKTTQKILQAYLNHETLGHVQNFTSVSDCIPQFW